MVLIISHTIMFWSPVAVKEGILRVFHSSPVACIEEDQECSFSLTGIVSDLVSGSVDSSLHSVRVCIVEALDLVFADAIGFDALLKLVSPLFGTRQVRILDLFA